MTLPGGAALAAKTAAPDNVEASSRPRIAWSDAGDFAREFRRPPPRRAPASRWVVIGWKLGLVIDVGLLSLPVPAAIVIPPLLECRRTSLHVGFFAGDSFEHCAERRIAARWAQLDSRIKRLVRGSGR